ncbi:MAG TPA: heme o synthase [Phycisphaerae bacterium]|nr:heme o synthase [Phycisphaerae bacterium]
MLPTDSNAVLRPATLPAFLRMRFADYCILGKVRISVLVLIVTAIGFCLGSTGPVNLALLIHTLIGTCLVAISANTLNQFIERDLDRLMIRTADRPIPAGRLTPLEALTFGTICGIVGSAYLVLFVNLWAASLAGATILLYLFAYTPLKRVTAWNTWVGAVPGALPPLIGFAAAHRGLTALAWMLFAVLFIWQLPHFFAIAWMYREDYARGGYRMLATVDPSGRSTRWQTLALSVMLVAISLLPVTSRYVSVAAGVGILVAGAAMIAAALVMSRRLTRETARRVLLASVIYLPIVMMLYLLGRVAL